MTDLLAILTSLSQVLGFPAALALAWAAFVIRDHGKRISELENADKAIPEGVYNLENSKSPKFKRELPLVYNKTVKASRGIRIHRGNTAKDSQGCVLVGMGRNYIKPTAMPALLESAPAETMVTMLCRNVTKLAVTEAVG